MKEQIQALLDDAMTKYPGKCRTDSDVIYFIKAAITVLLRAELARSEPEAEPIHMEANP